MKPLVAFLLLATAAFAAAPEDTVILTDTGVKNLRLESVVVEESDFEETVFALGRIEARHGRSAAVTSRVSGRVLELKVLPGDTVTAGQEVARIETRQPGNPPPAITLTAPLAGLVTSLDARLGDPVEPDRPILAIADLSEVHAIAHIPEHLAGSIPPGATTHIRVSALPDQTFQGTLLRFGTSAHIASGTIDAVFALPNPTGLLRPGMRAEFSIVLKKRPGVVSIPRSALQGDAANRFVYVKDFDLPNAFVKTPVVVGAINDRSAEIVSGLLPADEVVTRGAYSLAFAGTSGISLKAALDAAHGHEHNADGSEITPEQKKAASSASTPAAPSSGAFWPSVSAILFVLLIFTALRKRAPPRHAQ